MTTTEPARVELSADEVAEAARRLELLGLNQLAAGIRDTGGCDTWAATALHDLGDRLLDVDPAGLTRAAAVHWLELLWLPEDEIARLEPGVECVDDGPHECDDKCSGCYCHMIGGQCGHCWRVGTELARLEDIAAGRPAVAS